MFRVFPALIVFFLCAGPAHAEVRLAIWNPPGFKYAYVVAVREGESLAAAVGRYQGAVNLNPDLRASLVKNPLALKNGKLSLFSEQASGPRALVLANKAVDMQRAQDYVDAPAKPLRARGVKPYVLPLAAELGLSASEAEEFRAKLTQEFDLLLAIGGDDNHPRLYGREITYAKEPLSMTRDLAEKNLIEHYTKSERGFFLGICRGSQLLGITMGCPLVQDIEKEKNVAGHRHGFHSAWIDRGQSEHLTKIFPGAAEIEINTLHHQAVAEGNSLLRVVARDPFGVVEATELANGRGLGVQFHPELMSEKTKNPFFDYIATQAQSAYAERVRGSCESRYARFASPN